MERNREMHTSDNGLFVVYCLDVACRSTQSLSAAIQVNMSTNCHLFFGSRLKRLWDNKTRKNSRNPFDPQRRLANLPLLCKRLRICASLTDVQQALNVSRKFVPNTSNHRITLRDDDWSSGEAWKPLTLKSFQPASQLVSTISIQCMHPKKGECCWFMRRLVSKVIY